MTPRVSREMNILGTLVLVSLALHVHTKYQRDVMQELIWICHPAALVLGLGLLFKRPSWVGVGFIFHLCVGLPVFMFNFVLTGDTTWTSFLEHWMCPIAGAWGVWRLGLPKHAHWVAWSLLVSLIVVARLFTEPRLNINLAHRVYGPLKPYFPNHWVYVGLNMLAALAVLWCVARLIRLVLSTLKHSKKHPAES